MIKKNVLYPNYYQSFSCIANECKNTCCGGWNIYIDKQTLKKYKNSNHPLLKNKTKQLFKQNLKGNTVMSLDKDMMCPLLDDKKLCSIHKELGNSYLCITCKIYPRVFKQIDDTIEIGLSASCEAAAKLILENKDGISFELGEQDIPSIVLQNQATTSDSIIKRNFWPIRIFIIEALQARDLSIEERLAVIGLFVNKIKDAKTDHDIEELIEIYSQQIYNGSHKGIFDSLNNHKDLLKIQTHILNSIQLNIHKASTYKHLTIGLNENLFSDKFDLDIYIETHSSYKEFISQRQYMLENYLVNSFFNSSNIFDDSESLKKVFTGLAIRAGLIKNITTNALIINKDLTTEEFFLLVSKLSRLIDHSKELDTVIPKTLKESNFDSTSNLLVLTI